MKKTVSAAVLLCLLLMILCSVGVSAESAFQGDGTENSPYRIETAEDLTRLSRIVNRGTDCKGFCFEQTADIDMTGVDWEPIGSDKNCFAGTYDGNGYCISNLRCHNGRAALMDNLTGSVYNVVMDDFQVSGLKTAAVAVTVHYGAIIAGCRVSGVNEGFAAGGIAYSNCGSIIGCVSDCTFTQDSYASLVYHGYGKMKNCMSTDPKFFTGEYTGRKLQVREVSREYLNSEAFVKEYNRALYDAAYYDIDSMNFVKPLQYTPDGIVFCREKSLSVLHPYALLAILPYILFGVVGAASAVTLIAVALKKKK